MALIASAETQVASVESNATGAGGGYEENSDMVQTAIEQENGTIGSKQRVRQTVASTISRPENFEADIARCYKKLLEEHPDEDKQRLKNKCREMYSEKPVQSRAENRCNSINAELRKELELALEKARSADDEDLERIKEHIHKIKEKIEENKRICWQPAVVRAVETSSRPECELQYQRMKKNLEILKDKLAAYEGSDIAELERHIQDYEQEIREKAKECSREQQSEGEEIATEWIEEETEPSSIATYYQAKMDTILSKEDSIDGQIRSLKTLRERIDEMIRQLLEKKESIEADDFSGLVEKFRVRPKEIIADEVGIEAENKEITKTIDDKDIRIKALKEKVMLKVDDVEVEASDVELSDKIKIEDMELKALPDKIKERVKTRIRRVVLLKEKDRLKYQIKTQEKRKILGLIDAEAEKEIELDASSEEAEIIKEEKPWWYGISTASE